jgi:AraC family transcriptional regulator
VDDGIKEEYLRSAYRVVFYIEQNYASELTLEELSSVAGFSKYHFHRIFKSVIGESLGDFIRRARLAKTSMKFKTDERITKIAMESGYETSASFAKAFKKHFGITPREFGKSSRVTKGEAMLEAKFVDFDAVEVFYVRKTGAYEKSCCEAWEALMKFAYEQKIKHLYRIKIHKLRL